MSSMSAGPKPLGEVGAQAVEDSITDLVEKLISVWGDHGLRAGDEAEFLTEELRYVVDQSYVRVLKNEVSLLHAMKRGGR